MNMWQLTQEISTRKQATGKCDHEGSPQNASSPSGPESSSQIVGLTPSGKEAGCVT